MSGHIVAMGGGGFSMEPDNPLLDEFILSLAPNRPAKICFFAPMSTPCVGSCRRKICGRVANHFASSASCWFPPLSLAKTRVGSGGSLAFCARAALGDRAGLLLRDRSAAIGRGAGIRRATRLAGFVPRRALRDGLAETIDHFLVRGQ